MPNQADCPLCLNAHAQLVFTAKASGRMREFWQCSNCDLLFVPAIYHVSNAEEEQQYRLHNNESTQAGYVQFLGLIADQVCDLTTLDKVILDFGSGPNPVLAGLLREKGYQVDLFDPIFSPDESALRAQYDVVTCSEVAEHFNCPKKSWERLVSLMAPSGNLFVMTHRRDEVKSLEQWYYIRDITHVAFYSNRCMQWLASTFDLNIRFLSERVTLFSRR